MYLTLEEVREELDKILRNGKNVMESVCVLSTFNKQGQVGNKLTVDIIYSPVFSKQDEDEVRRKVMLGLAQEKTGRVMA